MRNIIGVTENMLALGMFAAMYKKWSDLAVKLPCIFWVDFYYSNVDRFLPVVQLCVLSNYKFGGFMLGKFRELHFVFLKYSQNLISRFYILREKVKAFFESRRHTILVFLFIFHVPENILFKNFEYRGIWSSGTSNRGRWSVPSISTM